MKDYLAKVQDANGKEAKSDLAVELLDFLAANKWFVDAHENFKDTVYAKFEEFKNDPDIGYKFKKFEM